MCPFSSSLARIAGAFSMMPLWITATVPVQSQCGWALRVVGAPCVAQRVCAIPVVACGRWGPSWASSCAIFPAAFTTRSLPSVISASPAES